MKVSAATKRARQYPKDNREWYAEFTYSEVTGIGYEEGVFRRDPSDILKIGDEYYVWYTKSVGPCRENQRCDVEKEYPWDFADIWYAVSKDGINWTEKGCAVHRGEKGSYDERTICTPNILKHNDKYYLVYQCMVSGEDYVGTYESVAMAVSDSPDGPWEKSKSAIIARKKDGFWFAGSEEDKGTYNDCEYEGTVHDPSLFFYNDKFYLYYKCSLVKNRKVNRFCGGDARWGVAISDNIEGPYIPSEFNPITNSGHETMLWQYDGGIACILNTDGPERETIQYAKNGIDFEIKAVVKNSPTAAGILRVDNTDDAPLEGIRWGLYHPRQWGYDYIKRFDTHNESL